MLIKPSASLQSTVYSVCSLSSPVSRLPSPQLQSPVYSVTQSVRQSVCSCLFRLEISSISVWKLFKSTTCNFLPNLGLSWRLCCLSVCLPVRPSVCLLVCPCVFCAEIKKLIPNNNKKYYTGLQFGNAARFSVRFFVPATLFPVLAALFPLFCTHFCHVDKHQCFALFSHHLHIYLAVRLPSPAAAPPAVLCLVLFLWLHFCVLHSPASPASPVLRLAREPKGNWAGNWHISLAH